MPILPVKTMRQQFLGMPIGISLITWGTGVRWFGWGLFEAFLPIFIFRFSGSYTESGFVRSAFNAAFLLALPLAGVVANVIPAKKVVLGGLAIYPLIGVAYYVSGVTGAVFFVVIARLLNGFSYAFDVVGRLTYFRQHVIGSRLGMAIGSLETIANLLWIIAALIGLLLLRIMPLHVMFLAIIPTTLLTMLMVAWVPNHEKVPSTIVWRSLVSWRTYTSFIQEVMLWRHELKHLALLSFFWSFMYSVIDFFLPVQLYEAGASPERIVFYTIIYTAPVLVAFALGWLADKVGKRLLRPVFLLIAVCFLALAAVQQFAAVLLIAFLISILGIFLDITIDVEMTRRGDPRRYGTVSSAVLEVGTMGAIIGPVIIGYTIDALGMQWTVIGLACIAAVISLTLNHHQKI